MNAARIANLDTLLDNAEVIAREMTEMSYIELSTLTDVLFRNNPEIAEWIARDLETRAMDKAICEAEAKGEFLL